MTIQSTFLVNNRRIVVVSEITDNTIAIEVIDRAVRLGAISVKIDGKALNLDKWQCA